MNIIYASNDAYAQYLGISMLSLLENNQDIEEIIIYILDQNIKPENKNKFQKIIKQYNRELVYIDIAEFEKLIPFDFDASGYNPITLSRLFLCSYLPDQIDRILYLDCDTIISGSIGELETISFDGNYVAAVPELHMPVEKKALIGHAKDETYYNAGVLLVNMDLWRQDKIETEFVEYYRSMNGRLLYNDQDIINHCCKGKIKKLSHTYNLSTNLFYFHRFFVGKLQPAYDTASATAYKDILKAPSIIHYMGDERPWIEGNYNKYRKYYYQYKAMSPWKEEPMIRGQRIYMLCYHALNIITFICPWFRIAFSRLIGINKYKWFSKK